MYINLKNQTSLHTTVLDQESFTLTRSGVKSVPDLIGQSLTYITNTSLDRITIEKINSSIKVSDLSLEGFECIAQSGLHQQ